MAIAEAEARFTDAGGEDDKRYETAENAVPVGMLLVNASTERLSALLPPGLIVLRNQPSDCPRFVKIGKRGLLIEVDELSSGTLARAIARLSDGSTLYFFVNRGQNRHQVP